MKGAAHPALIHPEDLHRFIAWMVDPFTAMGLDFGLSKGRDSS
jgi:hypothetical protein